MNGSQLIRAYLDWARAPLSETRDTNYDQSVYDEIRRRCDSFTPDQPAPTEDEVREYPYEDNDWNRRMRNSTCLQGKPGYIKDLAILIARGGSMHGGYVEDAEAIHAAGYRRQPDQRPTRGELDALAGVSKGYRSHPFSPVGAFIDAMIKANLAVPDPPEPKRVPEFASVEEAEAWFDGRTITPGFHLTSHPLALDPRSRWAASTSQRDYIEFASTKLEALQALANAVHAAEEGRDD
jgi:hypothetical protein